MPATSAPPLPRFSASSSSANGRPHSLRSRSRTRRPASAATGEPAFAATAPVTLLNPQVIIEVLSETTEEYDRGAKVAHYRRRASVDLILLIDSRRRMVERQQRNPDGTWTLSEHASGMVVVLDHEVPLDELYDGVALVVGRA